MARVTISSAWARACRRTSARSWSALADSARARSAASTLSRIFLARSSSMPMTGLYRNRCRTNSRMMKLSAWMAMLPGLSPSASMYRSSRRHAARSIRGLVGPDPSEQHEGDDQGIDGDSFGKRQPDDHRQKERAGRLGVASDRLHRLADADADADARPDG